MTNLDKHHVGTRFRQPNRHLLSNPPGAPGD